MMYSIIIYMDIKHNHSVLIPQLDLVSEKMFFSLRLHNFLEIRVHIKVVEISVQHIMAEFIVILK